MAESLPVIIDTDCGVDDAVALWWALTSPRLDVVAFTTVWGNVGVDGAAGNVGRILDALGRGDLAIALGGDEPFAPAPELRVADFIHGSDGLGNTFRPEPTNRPSDETAVALLRRIVDERPGEITIITLGPLSNIAAAIAQDPTWPTRVKDLYVMGGAVAVQGNALPQGEANIAHDPAAADVVARADWPNPPMLVGLDVTLAATFTPAIFDLLAEQRNPAAAFLDEPMLFYRTFGSTLSPPG